jgi:hypothetical protein
VFRITSLITVTLNTSVISSMVQGGGGWASRIILDNAAAGILVELTQVGSPGHLAFNNTVAWRDFYIVPNTAVTGYAVKFNGSSTVPTSTNAGSFVVGGYYRITTVGTTDFTLIGAANNTVGTYFVATGVGTGSGTATATTTGSSVPMVNLNNVNITPSSNSNYATVGFEFFNCRQSVMTNCSVWGLYGNWTTTTGVKWGGDPLNTPVKLNIMNCMIYWHSRGVDLVPASSTPSGGVSDWQGIYIVASDLIACDYCVYAVGTVDFAELLFIHSSHLNCRTAGVWASRVMKLQVNNNYMIIGTDTPTSASYGVYQENFGSIVPYGSVINNDIQAADGPTTLGNRYVVFQSIASGASGCQVAFNRGVYTDAGYVLAAFGTPTASVNLTNSANVRFG